MSLAVKVPGRRPGGDQRGGIPERDLGRSN
jgi:hypothetical protein